MKDGKKSELSDLSSSEAGQTGVLQDKVVLLVGSDRIDGKSLALSLAEQGAHVVFLYTDGQHEQADEMRRQVWQKGRRCLSIPLSSDGKTWSKDVMAQVIDELGRLDIFIDATALTGTVNGGKSETDTAQQSLWSRPFSNFDLVSAALRQIVEGNQKS